MNPVIQIIFWMHIAFDYVVDFLLGLYFKRRKQTIHQPDNNLILESATSLAKKIWSREITSEEVVRAFIDRIRDVNPLLNAVVDDRFDIALEEARQIDQGIKTGKITEDDFTKKPFLGVPFTTKESIICKGLSITFGLASRKHEFGADDAKVVELMKKAGGILLGVTNVPELNRWTESYNPVYGTTNNPYDTTRNVGGSSGGEACIIAARGSPIGIGSDIGGSLRIPAFRCGIFGYKPTPELISTYGMTFRDGSEFPTIVTAGAMSAHAEDLIPLTKVLLGDNVDKLELDKDVDVKKLRIYYVANSTCLRSSPISSPLKKLILKCADYFSSYSEVTPQEVNFQYLRYSIRLWMYMIGKEADVFTKQITNNRGEASAIGELIKFLTFQSEFTLYTLLNILNDRILPRPSGDWPPNALKQLKQDVINTLGDDGVLLFPSEPYPVGYHYTSLARPFNFSYYALWNTLKCPAVQVPLGLNEAGLPVGIQVVAAPFKDHLCVAVAKELEKAFGGYVPPFPLDDA